MNQVFDGDEGDMSKKIEIKPNDQSWVGKLIRADDWPEKEFIKILYVGKEEIFASDTNGEEDTYYITRIHSDWELYEEPEEKLGEYATKEACENGFCSKYSACPYCQKIYDNKSHHLDEKEQQAFHAAFRGSFKKCEEQEGKIMNEHCPLCPTLKQPDLSKQSLSFHLIEFHKAQAVWESKKESDSKIETEYKEWKEKECEHEWEYSDLPGGRRSTRISNCKKCLALKKDKDPFWLKVGDIIKDHLFEEKWGRVISFGNNSVNIEWHHKNSTLKDHITDEEILLKYCHSGTYKKIKLVSPALFLNKSQNLNYWVLSDELYFSDKGIGEHYPKESFDIIWPAKDQFGREIWYEVEE